ncbi:MAG TPA: glycerophosphodiester phosphodiesterase [Acidimicrobiia bacterium]|nr:glycerophosphodiester phosphodiesterase [Acidimicrobiia bacterium]
MFFSGSGVWGHRGWPSRYPDNTVAGIRAAAEVAVGVEIDIRRSVDGQFVLSHDPELGGRAVAETAWSQLAAVDLAGHRPALLTEVMDIAARLDLEVKNDPSEPGFDDTHRTAREVAERARASDIVTSFWWPSMDAIRVSHPAVATGLLFSAPVDPLAAVRHAVDHGHHTIAPEHVLVDEVLMTFAAAEGLEVVTWTVDDVAEATRLAGLGVSAIITNRPGELIAEDPTVRNR